MRYKYEDSYTKYQSFSLQDEFNKAREYLLFNENHANDKVFAAVDEIYHWFCVKQIEVEELRIENDQLKKGLSDDPFIALIQEASKSVFKSRAQHNATATYHVLTRNGVDDIESLMRLSVIDAAQFRNAGSNVVAVIGAAKDLYRSKQDEGLA